jgi:predicted nucleic acid-binding protein
MARVLVDTSAIYALLDRSDANHQSARGGLEQLKRRRLEPLLTNFLVAECHALLLGRLGAGLARQWLVQNQWSIERIGVEDEARARAIIGRFTDKTYSYTDATSFAAMDRLGLRMAFTFDPHFTQYGFQALPAERQ